MLLRWFNLGLREKPRKLEAQRAKELYERQCRDAERKREIEREKAEKREQVRLVLTACIWSGMKLHAP